MDRTMEGTTDGKAKGKNEIVLSSSSTTRFMCDGQSYLSRLVNSSVKRGFSIIILSTCSLSPFHVFRNSIFSFQTKKSDIYNPNNSRPKEYL